MPDPASGLCPARSLPGFMRVEDCLVKARRAAKQGVPSCDSVGVVAPLQRPVRYASPKPLGALILLELPGGGQGLRLPPAGRIWCSGTQLLDRKIALTSIYLSFYALLESCCPNALRNCAAGAARRRPWPAPAGRSHLPRLPERKPARPGALRWFHHGEARRQVQGRGWQRSGGAEGSRCEQREGCVIKRRGGRSVYKRTDAPRLQLTADRSR